VTYDDAGSAKVAKGDVVTALCSQKLAQMRHVYRFGWMDATAAAGWLEKLPGALYDSNGISRGGYADAEFIALVFTANRAALYVAAKPPTDSDITVGQALTRGRDSLILYLDRLGDGTQPWVHLGGRLPTA
jgi:hypothetical protein